MRKHAKEIIAWARGHEIEWYSNSKGKWMLTQDGCQPHFLHPTIKLRVFKSDDTIEIKTEYPHD
jgi:hypothetical protein